MDEKAYVTIEDSHYRELIRDSTHMAIIRELLELRMSEYASIPYKEVETLARLFCGERRFQEVREK